MWVGVGVVVLLAGWLVFRGCSGSVDAAWELNLRGTQTTPQSVDRLKHGAPRTVEVTLQEGRDIPAELAATFAESTSLSGSLSPADDGTPIPVSVQSNGRRPWSVTINWMEPPGQATDDAWKRSFRLGSGSPPASPWSILDQPTGQQLVHATIPLVKRVLLADTIEPPSTATAGSLEGTSPSRIEDIVLDPSDREHRELFRFVADTRNLERNKTSVASPDVDAALIQSGPNRSLAHWIEHSQDAAVRARERREVTAWQPVGDVRLFDFRLDLDARGSEGGDPGLAGFRTGCQFASTTESGWMRPWGASHVGGKELWRDAAWGASRIDGDTRSWIVVLMRHPENPEGLLVTTEDGFLGVQFEQPFGNRGANRGTLRFRVVVLPRERTATPEAIGRMFDEWVNEVAVEATLVR